MADKDVRFILSAVDNATVPLRRVTAQLNRMSEPANLLRKRFSNLFDATQFSKIGGALSGVGRQMRTLGLYATGAAGAFGYFVKSSIDQADQIGDTADKLGLTAQQFQALSFAAEQAGAKSGTIFAALPIFLKNMGKLGKKGSPIELLEKAAEDLSKIKDPAKLAYAGTQLFGKGFKEIRPLLLRGREGIEALFEEFQRAGGGISDSAVEMSDGADKAFRRLGVSLGALRSIIVEAFAPAATAAADAIGAWIGELRKIDPKAIEDFAKRATESTLGFVDFVRTSAIPTIASVVDGLGGWQNAAIAAAVAINGSLIASIINLGVVLATTPAGQFLLALTAVGALGYAAYKSFSDLPAFDPKSMLSGGTEYGFSDRAGSLATNASQLGPYRGEVGVTINMAKGLTGRSNYVESDSALDLSVNMGPAFGY